MPLHDHDAAILEAIAHVLDRLLLGQQPELLDSNDTTNEALKHVCESLNNLLAAFADASSFLRALSEGRLDVEPPPRNVLISPFKQLHSNLKHLTWQTNQITKGDLNQRVDFLGEFSVSFNEMIASLREKERLEKDLADANVRLERLATTDTLTGISNRLKFSAGLQQEINRSRRYGPPLALIMFDIDHFKQINDTHGHQAGDAVLQVLARVVSSTLRKEDIFARWGGEEFVVLLPHSEAEGASRLAGRLRLVVEQNVFPVPRPVTCSFGVSCLRESDDPDSFLARADEALYRAKNAGRNRVEMETPETPGSTPNTTSP